MIESRWVDNEQIHGVIPELTIRCSKCGGASRSPEDIVAVYADPASGQVIGVFVLCDTCTTEMLKGAVL